MDRNKLIIQTFDRVADAYQQKFMDFNLYDDSYDEFCHLVANNNAKILEVGCGPGNITRYLSTKRPDFNMTAIDNAPNMLALARKNVPSAKFELRDARDINTINSKFDGIVVGFCFPYLSQDECITLIRDSAALLKVGGVIYLSYIDGNYDKSGFEHAADGSTYHTFYHQQDYLTQALANSGFSIAAEYQKPYIRTSGAAEIHTILIARKAEYILPNP